MFHWLTERIVSATGSITFFTIFLVGVTFSVFSLILGGHGDGDHDADHDVGHDSDSSSDHHDGGGDAGSHGFFSVGIFSVRGIALLATGFGGIGFLIYVSTGRMLFSTVAAFLGGYVFAFAVLYTLKVFKGQQANSLVRMSGAIGSQGIVTIGIPENGLGEVSLVVSGMEMYKPARSRTGAPIKSGTPVRVSEITGGALVVTPSDAASSLSNTGT